MAITYSFLAFAVTAGAAYFDNATYGPGPGLETLRDRPSSSESIVNNIRQSANFDLVYQGGYNVSRWSMSVDVTEYNTSQQVVNTIYALGFPSYDASNATLSEALPNERGQNDVNFDSSTALCATIVHNLLPANITNTLLSPNEDDNSTILANAQCSNVLGLPCMNAIIKAFVEHETDNVCKGTDLDLSDIDECKDAFSDEEFKSSTINLNSASVFQPDGLRSGDPFWHTTFEGQNVTDSATDVFQAESARMHVVLFQTGGEFSSVCLRPDTGVRALQGDSSTGAAPQEGGAGILGVNVWRALAAVAVVFAFLP